LQKPLNAYQRELKIMELLYLTDQPDEQVKILRHTTANAWKKLIPPDDVGQAILARRVEDEVAERNAQRAERSANATKLWMESLHTGDPE
jgi:hypothetical protein